MSDEAGDPRWIQSTKGIVAMIGGVCLLILLPILFLATPAVPEEDPMTSEQRWITDQVSHACEVDPTQVATPDQWRRADSPLRMYFEIPYGDIGEIATASADESKFYVVCLDPDGWVTTRMTLD